MKKQAFTLAEVLITLGIIGIVAAMTLPAIMANTDKTKTVSQLKKAYTNLAQAVKLSEVKNESCEYWDYTLPADEFFKRYLSEFLSIGASSITDLNVQYKYLNGNDCFEDLCTTDSYIRALNDGTLIIVSRHQFLTNGRVISVDINGLKKPNVVGKDFFSFAITPKNGVVPFGYGDFGFGDIDGEGNAQFFGNYDRNVLTANKTYACNKAKQGFWCTALIMYDGWEIKRDYPWK